MRIGIVIPTIWDANAFTTDPRILVDGFERSGHEAVIFCTSGSRFPRDSPAAMANRTAFGNVDFWRQHELDGAIVFTWLSSHLDVVSALVAAETFVISKADTDGLCGPRTYPGETLRRAVYSSSDSVSRARNVWIWTKRLTLRRDHDDYVRGIVEPIRQAGATIVETATGRENLVAFLRDVGAGDMDEKVHFVPNPAADPFVLGSVPEVRERLIYAVGRWDSVQKNGRLLSGVLRRYLRDDSEARVVLAGSGKIKLPQVRVERIGQVTRTELAAVAARARVCLITSQWEGSHIAGHEALASGATIVGTPIPAVKSMTNRGQFGSVASGHRVSSVVAALAREMRAWDDGRRSPLKIAHHWRACLSAEAVAEALIDLIARPR
jgi:Glycosyl transferases group 1